MGGWVGGWVGRTGFFFGLLGGGERFHDNGVAVGRRRDAKQPAFLLVFV